MTKVIEKGIKSFQFQKASPVELAGGWEEGT